MPPDLPVADARSACAALSPAAADLGRPLYLGFAPGSVWPCAVDEPDRAVDAFFSLTAALGFETTPSLLTFGVRASRFALIVFWEALHALRAGGTWIDIDLTEAFGRSSIGARDVLDRPYFAHSLDCLRELRVGRVTAKLWRKQRASLISPRIAERGWTFGILTSGPSPRACRMVGEIQALGLPDYEIVLCGSDPGPLADEAGVRRIDLERPEPRGWITRKKNLVAERARFENLCLLHDRFRIPVDFAEAVDRFGPAPGITTFPQLFFPEPSRTVYFRNVDYQALRPTAEHAASAARLVNFRLDQFAYPRYNDWRETFHVNGGAYLARRSLWRAVPQDESLFHGEWEDIAHGLACHEYGIPQRTNPHTILESVHSHSSILAHLSLQRLTPQGTVERRPGFTSSVFLAHRLLAPRRLKPIGRITEARLRAQAAEVLPRLPAALRDSAREALAEPIGSLASWWRALSRRWRGASPATRDEALAMLELLWRCAASPVWHANHVQRSLRELELDDSAWGRLLDGERRNFTLWERLYPAFFDRPEASTNDAGVAAGPQARRRRLQAMHWRSDGCRNLVHSRTSLGEQPRLDLLPDDGARVHWMTAVLATVLWPLERIVSLRPLQRALLRAARLAKKMVG